MGGGGERFGTSHLSSDAAAVCAGLDFSYDQTGTADNRKLHSCWIIPERGSWVELNVTKKETLAVRIDQSGKFSAITLLRAMSEELSTDRDILRHFYPTKVVKKGRARRRPRSPRASPTRSPSATSSC
jgi:DNA-directed RNA polymerase subunit beta